MADKKETPTLFILLIILLVAAVYMGGVPFLGAMIMLEGGNEIQFKGEQIIVTKEIDNQTGLNVTQTIAAVTDVERQLTTQSKYVDDAYMRITATSGLNDSTIEVEYDVTTDNVTTTVEETLWTQTEPLTEIEEIDLMDILSDKEQGDIITFKFHSTNPGSLVIATFLVEWGPTEAQIAVCESSGGTFDEDTVTCDCPSTSTGFAWTSGCKFAADNETDDTGGNGAGYQAPTPDPTTELQAPAFDINKWHIIAIIAVIGLLIYYHGFEKGPNRGLFKKR